MVTNCISENKHSHLWVVDFYKDILQQAKNKQTGFSISDVEQVDVHMKIMNLDPVFTPYTSCSIR